MKPHTRRLRDYAVLYSKGLAMGAADVVPGVSGGTMALILGIYRELIASLGAVTSSGTLSALAAGRVREALLRIGAPFLLVLALGIATSVLLLSGAIVAALEASPSLVFALFFGLILASVFAVAAKIARWHAGIVAALVAGAALGYWLVGLAPTTAPTDPLSLALSGALAICALILPGISGAFILVLLGHYTFVLASISQFDLAGLLPFAIGGVVGLLSFTRLLSWLLKHAETVTLAVLTGFMLGSLRKVWPWQEGDDILSRNLAPPDAASALVAVLAALVGVALVVVLDRLGRGSAGKRR